MNSTLAVILARRSVSPRRLVEPGPSPEQMQLLIRAAAAAPDHKRLRPFRFVLILPEARAALAQAFRRAKRERDPTASDAELERAGAKAFSGPMLLAIVLRIVRDHPRVSVTDQVLAAGAACENMLLAAQSLGFAACLRSGTSATSQRVREALRLEPQEELAGFMIVGTPTQAPPHRVDDTMGLLTTWNG
jgi:nitroreductase